MHTEKIQQLEKALKNPAATPEMKAKFQAAIDKLKAEVKPEEKPQPEKVVKKKKELRPKKQAETVKKAVAEKKEEKAQTDNAAAMQELIDNATKSSEAWSHNKVLAEAQKFQKLRPQSAQTLDSKGDSKKRLTPTRENLIRWMNNPGNFDLIGVDTFKAGDATADLKIKKEIFWNRFGIKYNH